MKRRVDGWTEDQDELLTETVLNFVREGRTQLEAFQKVAEQISRTAGACGYRWNAVLRKKYTRDLEEARRKRKRSERIKEAGTARLDAIIRDLEKMRAREEWERCYQRDLEMIREELKKVRRNQYLLYKKVRRAAKND